MDTPSVRFTINPLEDFLSNCDLIRMDIEDPKCCIPYEEFQLMYLNFCRRNNYDKGIRFNKDHWGTTFELHGLIVKSEKKKGIQGHDQTRHQVDLWSRVEWS